MTTSPFPAPTADLMVAFRVLRKTVGDFGLKLGVGPVLLLLVYRRIGQIMVRMERLVAQYQAGTLRRVKPRVAAPKRDDAEKRTRAKPLEVLPRKFGWLRQQMGWQLGGHCGQFETILHRPEMVEMLVACPQAIRILRPLCRMLGMDPRFLQPGVPVVFIPPVAKVVKKRVRKPRPKVDWGNIPLPRGMLAWAKKQGFGKVPRD